MCAVDMSHVVFHVVSILGDAETFAGPEKNMHRDDKLQNGFELRGEFTKKGKNGC